MKDRLSPDVFAKMQKWAALVVLNTPIIVLPLALMPAQMLSSYFDKFHNLDMGFYVAFSSGFFLSLISTAILIFILHRTIKNTSSQFKFLREEVLEELSAATAGADITSTTWEDINKSRPYVATFCLQYTPCEYQHEEKVVWRKIVSVVGIIVMHFFATGMAEGGCQAEVFEYSQASIQAVFVGANFIYVPHLLRRPYVSLRKSGRMGDPLNDAELLTTRTMSWAAAILTIREVVFRNHEWGNWVMDAFGVVVLVALMYSQYPLFYGLSGDTKDAASEAAKKLLKSKEEDAPPQHPRRNLRHSDAANPGTGLPIEKMLNSESFREILLQQSKLNLAAMDPKERARWQPPVPSSSRSGLAFFLQSALGRRKGIVAYTLFLLSLIALLIVSYDFYLACGLVCIMIGHAAGSLKHKLPASTKSVRVTLSGLVAVLEFTAAFLFAHAWLKYAVLYVPLRWLLILTPMLLCLGIEILVAKAKRQGEMGQEGVLVQEGGVQMI